MRLYWEVELIFIQKTLCLQNDLTQTRGIHSAYSLIKGASYKMTIHSCQKND
jgi:hypothetical protein